MSRPIDQAAFRLTSGLDSILREPTVRLASQSDAVEALAVAHRQQTRDGYMVEAFDGGALVYLDRGTRQKQETVVGIIVGDRVRALVVSSDDGEAMALYAGIATVLGVLNGRCDSCGAPIPSVYEYCRACVT